VSAKLARRDGAAQLLRQPADELFVQRDGDFGPGGTAIGRTVPFVCAGEQGELADHQNLTTHVLNGKIHHPLIVIKDA